MSLPPLVVIEVDLRCAYCGLHHQVKVTLRQHGDHWIPKVEALSEGCDVMDWRPASIIEPLGS